MKSYHQKFVSDHPYESSPMAEIAGFPVRPGIYDLNGATPLQNGVNFTIHTCGGTSCELLLFHRAQEEPFAVLPFPEAYKIGDVYSMIVYGLNIDEFEYAYRVDGPYCPEKGLLFDKNKILLDPYAKAVAGQRTWGIRWDHTYHARVVKDRFDWGDMPQSKKELCDLIIYELHVRDFTHHPSSGVQHRGTFSGLMEKIPYLKELGINAVELMPIFEFDETMNSRTVDGKQLLECWGYNTVGFFAPNSSYAAANEHNQEGTELKTLIKALHDNGIEVILDVVFNHTAEGNEKGNTFSFKGFDNNIYYMLTPDGNYYNFSGCGNTLNCNHPVVQQLILECLRYWTINYRVDGFRFDLASILGRNEDGSPMNNPPLLRTLADDSILSNVKLIAEAWDAGGLYQVGSFPASGRWAEWNGRYRDSLRSYLKGDSWNAWDAAWSISGSGDLYGGYYDNTHSNYAGYNSCVNFLTCHDGFTLYDLYAYNDKHNEANGWNNTDGDNNGHSWNCGAEGETDDPNVNGLRRRLIKNAFAALLCSRGPAMFFAGDEFCNTQFGNNNAYCQDNIISWLDWGRLEEFKEIHDFVRHMIQFRKEHPILRKMTKPSSCQFPEISVHNGTPFNASTDYKTKLIGIMYAGRNEEDTEDDIVFYCMNAYWEPLVMQLPVLPNGKHWHVDTNTNAEYFDGEDFTEKTELLGVNTIRVPARTTIILVAE